MNDSELSTKIDAVKDYLCYRAKNAGLNPDQVFHFEYGNVIYVICNPIIGSEELYDAYGYPTGELVNVRNVTAWYEDSFKNSYGFEGGIKPIRYPWLLAQIGTDGTVIYGSENFNINRNILQEIWEYQQAETTNFIHNMILSNLGVK